jgi:hypothetical protein
MVNKYQYVFKNNRDEFSELFENVRRLMQQRIAQ